MAAERGEHRLARVAGHLSMQQVASKAGLVDYKVVSGVAVLTMCSPPVNSLSPQMTTCLDEAVSRAHSDSQVKGIVITGAGPFFMAGADIPNLMKLTGTGDVDLIKSFLKKGHALMDKLESGPKPTVAAVNGPAFGGGLELAMGCNMRVAGKASKFGLPEIKLGLIPGMGGTQRLPRLIGVKAAVGAIVSGKSMNVKQALKAGVADKLVKKGKDLIPEAIKVALAMAVGKIPRPSALERKDRLGDLERGDDAVELARIKARRKVKGCPHPDAACNAIKAGMIKGGRAGIQAETDEFASLILTPSAKALIHMFLSSRKAAKVPGLGGVKPSVKVKTVAVLGGGTMGAGICALMLFKGYNVILKEINDKALFAGVKRISKVISSVIKRMRLPVMAMEMGMRNLTATTNYDDFKKADMVIEAIVENISIKQKVFCELEKHCRPDCILASNTSTIDLNVIGAKTKAQDRIVGLHFFSPAHIMPLLEIIRTKHTSKAVIAASLAYGKKIGKTSVVVGNCVGFTANRMFYPYNMAAAFLVDRGVDPYRIDTIVKRDVHMPMGVFQIADLSGVDIGKHVGAIFQKAYKEKTYGSALMDVFVEAKRLGQKAGKGFYKYKGRATVPDARAIAPLLAKSRAVAAKNGAKPVQVTDEEIMQMVTYPVVNESCRILAEGHAARASDIDIVSITGYGFPAHKGGLMHWGGESEGFKKVCATLKGFAQKYPEVSEFFKPCEYLEQLAAKSPK